MHSYVLGSLRETACFASHLAHYVKRGDVIALKGDLGAGKTAFARYFIQSLMGAETEVPSPTFTLVQTYDTPLFPLWHFDLYRLSKAEEAVELAIEDAFYEGVSLIEWPDIIADLLPEERLEITLQVGGKEEERKLLLTGYGEWYKRVELFLTAENGRRNHA